MKTVSYEAFSYFIFLYVRFTSPHLSILPSSISTYPFL